MSEAIFHDQGPDGVALSELGRYARLQDARERGLVVTTMDLPHWIVRHGREYALCVEVEHEARVRDALREFESEESSRAEERKVEPMTIPKLALLFTLLGMTALYRVQTLLAADVVSRGVADDLRIRAGEWWRCFTALTLHGDGSHLVSNLSLAVFAFAFVYGRFGVGFGLLGTVLGGALGNALNAVAHLSDAHRSLGSSTALFAALGLLSGSEIAGRIAEKSRARWPLIVPIGGAFAFLALYGGGGGQKSDGTPAEIGRVDLGAHLFGLAAGILVGALLHAVGVRAKMSGKLQAFAGGVALGLLAFAWRMAISV